MPPIEYDIVISNRGQPDVAIEWGRTPGWVDTYREQLNSATSIALIPRARTLLPIVEVHLGGGKRWILFSRMCGQITSGKQIRLYAIGWQNGKEKMIVWVYPGGLVEVAPEPTHTQDILGRM